MTENKPVLLDLFCGAGGAAKGYMEAGFLVVGVDIKPQPHYIGNNFIQADALEYLTKFGSEYDAVHASPPCQAYSIMNNLPWLKNRSYPLLILPTIEQLERMGRPYVLENVMGARYGAKGLKRRDLEAHGLKAGWLCGAAFGLPFYRHRLFATNWLWLAPGHPKHTRRIRAGGSLGGRARDIIFRPNTASRVYVRESGKYAGKIEMAPATGFLSPRLSIWQNGSQGVGIGHAKGWRLAAAAMGIDWMNCSELTQAIPPVYTHFIGETLMKTVRSMGK